MQRAMNMSGATVAVTTLFAGLAGCLPSSSNVVVSQASNSEYTATLSNRNSGAMSRGSTLVSVRLKNVPDNDTHGLIVLDVTWNRPVEMRWIGPHNLAVSCASCTVQDVDFEVVKSGDVVITYGDNLRVN
jgi:hypothetical protein